MYKIDAHHHLWDTRLIDYSDLGEVPSLNRPFLLGDYVEVAERHDVVASVCVEAASAGADGRKELAWLLKQLRFHPLIAGIVAWAPVDRPGIGEYLDEILNLGGRHVVGIRRGFETDHREFPASEEVVRGASVLAKYALPFDLLLYSHSLPAAVRLVEACPETQFVLDHLGKPRVKDRVFEQWSGCIRELGRKPNVVCKLSGLGTEADWHAWSTQDLRPYVEHTIECFGADRVMFGSDWPVCTLSGGYERWLSAVNELFEQASEAERQALFFGTARHVYGLGGRAPDSDEANARRREG